MMKVVIAGIVVAGVMSVSAVEPHYIGVDKCAKMCHKGEKKGSQYEIWLKSKHATAYATLATAQSKEVAKKVGVTVDPQKAPQCLRCHVTGYGAKKEIVDTTCAVADGVGCEACHGAGSEYRKINNMKNRQLAMAAGLVEQNEAVCIKCHNKESPTYKPFTFSAAVKVGAHPIPGRATKK